MLADEFLDSHSLKTRFVSSDYPVCRTWAGGFAMGAYKLLTCIAEYAKPAPLIRNRSKNKLAIVELEDKY